MAVQKDLESVALLRPVLGCVMESQNEFKEVIWRMETKQTVPHNKIKNLFIIDYFCHVGVKSEVFQDSDLSVGCFFVLLWIFLLATFRNEGRIVHNTPRLLFSNEDIWKSLCTLENLKEKRYANNFTIKLYIKSIDYIIYVIWSLIIQKNLLFFLATKYSFVINVNEA